MKNIYIYNDDGVVKKHIKKVKNWAMLTFNSKNVFTINSKDILSKKYLSKDNILIIPGGEARFYTDKLYGNGNIIIRDFIKNGGIYIGICAGAYYASSHIDFIGNDGVINTVQNTDGDLKLFFGTCKGTIREIAPLYRNDFSSATDIFIDGFSEKFKTYYNGGPEFIPEKREEVEIPFLYSKIDKYASIYKIYGKGKVFLFGFHPELSKDENLQKKLNLFFRIKVYSNIYS
ncbi:MAG: BPL-N domain-containing protein [Alphaproteobacteria bacterium]|jgi:glutamine amidotransferase-like uncharacterized protein|nr:BPL-N domain-containing protein [Alphaproteobacteria bacterium]